MTARIAYFTSDHPALTHIKEAYLFAVGALGEDLSATVSLNETVQFELHPDLFITTPESGPLTNIDVNFGNNTQYHTASIGSVLTTNYATPGEKTITVRAQFGGTTRYAQTVVSVRSPTPVGDTCALDPAEVEGEWECFDYQSDFLQSAYAYDASYYDPSGNSTLAQYDGSHGARYRYAVFYAYDNPYGGGDPLDALRNPIVVVDGIDLSLGEDGDSRHPLEIYNANLNERPREFSIAPRTELGSRLREEGYDIVILDYASALDFIQRNGLALVDLLTRINTANAGQGEETAAVVGPSMGGLVARYALAYMENNDIPHNVHVFGAFDAAMQGGHIPIGLQQLADDVIYHVPGSSFLLDYAGITEDDFDAVQKAPAVRQTLIFNASRGDYNQINQSSHYTQDPLRSRLYDDLLAVGDYPDDVRRLAVVNGTSDGNRQQTRLDGTGSQMVPGQRLSHIYLGAQLFGLGYQLTFDAHAAPSLGQTDRVFRRREYLCAPFVGCSIKVYDNQWDVSNIRPLDSAPGGHSNVLQQLEAGLDGAQEQIDRNVNNGTWGGYLINFYTFNWFHLPHNPFFTGILAGGDVYSDVHSFVPTVSALDYNTTGLTRTAFLNGMALNQPIEQAITCNPASCSQTPFDHFFISPDDENHSHTDVQPGVVSYVLEQLALPVPDRTPGPLTASISGPSHLDIDEDGIWAASVSGGSGSTTYDWDYRVFFDFCGPPLGGSSGGGGIGGSSGGGGVGTNEITCGQWHQGGTGSSFSRGEEYNARMDLRLTVTSGSESETAFKNVTIGTGPGGGLDPLAEGGESTTTAPSASAKAADTSVPERYALRGTAPNPVRRSATVEYDLPEASEVTLIVHDLLGREMARLASGSREAGVHSEEIDASTLPSGVYLVRLQAGTFAATERFTVVN